MFLAAGLRVISLAVVFIALVLISGCAVGPNFQRPTAPNVDRYTPQPLPARTASVDVKGGEAQRFVRTWTYPVNGGRCFIRSRSMT